MNKRFLIVALATIFVGIGLVMLLWFCHRSDDTPPLTKKEIAEKMAALAAESGQTNAVTQAVLVPLDLSQPVRLAVGGLGLADDNQNQRLGDLITTELTGTPGINLVERQSLAAILRELNLSYSGFMRARDAVRVGKLLKVDWFLLGTEAKINGTNSIVIRVVDARTGILRDAGVIAVNQSPSKLAADVAVFVRQSRQNAALAKARVYLAVGAFEDLSVNNRRADFPAQLRGYLTAAYQGGNVTLLEREYVETLLQEVRLDLAGLTETNDTNPPPPMQSAFWLVSGQYQSYETTNLQVELNLEVRRIFGTGEHLALRGLPGEPLGRQIKMAIDEVMNQHADTITPARASEARLQLAMGKRLSVWNESMSHDDYDLVVIGSNWYGNTRSDPQLAAKQKRRLEDAIRAFETVLLLEPNNHEAKMYLAAFMRNQLNLHPDEACNYYREIIDDPAQDKWSGLAQQALVETFLWFGPDEKLRWLQSAANRTTNEIASAFYRQQAQIAGADIIINAGHSPEAEGLAENRLFEEIQSAQKYFHGEIGARYTDHMGMREYVKVFGEDSTNAAHKLAALLPKMIKLAPDIEPYLVTSVLSFQSDTNTPVTAEFQAVLADAIEHPKRDIKTGQLWADMGGEIYYWCFEKTNYPLAVQLMEGIRRVAAEGYTDYGDEEKIKLAYAYLAMTRWQDALDIFNCYSNRPFPAQNGGPWGEAFQPIMTDELIAFCRNKLGQTVQQDTRKFEMGKPVLCLCAPSTFIADDNGLWIGIGGRLLHLDFELKTNLDLKLPMDDSLPITALSLTANDVWIGTGGDGLIEFNKASHHCRRFTEADGLLMNYLLSLQAAGDSLWIGYGSASGGGLGQMDLSSGKVKSFTPGLNVRATVSAEEDPPRERVRTIVADTSGNLQMLVTGRIRQFHASSHNWDTLPKRNEDWVGCFTADSEHFVESGSKGLAIQSRRDNRWQNLESAEGIPNPPTTLTLDGNNLWVGGEGYIALVDLKEFKVRKLAYIQAAGVDRIQIGVGYVWAQCDSHLYRAPLSDLQ